MAHKKKMLPAYKVKWCDKQKLGNKVTKALCSWSTQNWIAFTTGYTGGYEKDTLVNIDTVYVVDPNEPWQVFTINTGHGCRIEHVEWEYGGSRLFTVCQRGICKIWAVDNYVVNRWKCTEKINIGNGDQIKKIIWIHSGSKFSIDIEKIFLMKELFQKFVPHKNDFLANTNSDDEAGFVAVTNGGLVKVFLLNGDSKPKVYTARLGTIKSNIITSDIIVNDNGKLFVALLTKPCMIELFTVSWKQGVTGLDLVTDVWPCIVPQIATSDPDSFEITGLKCISVNSSDQVLVSSKSSSGFFVQVFETKKEQVLLHPFFSRQHPPSMQSADTSVCLKTFKFPQVVQIVAVTNLHYSGLGKNNDASLSPKLVLSDCNGSFHVYSLYNWSQVLKSSVIPSMKDDQIDCATFSHCDHGLFAISKGGHAMMFMLPHFSVCQEKLKIKNIVNLLHYSLVESCTAWDVMLYLCTVERPVLDACLKLFVDDYFELNVVYQNMFFSLFWRLKAMFYHVSKDYRGVLESYNIMMLRNIYLFFTSRLRSDKEVAFMEAVQKVCASSQEVDISKLTQMIDTKELKLSLATDNTHRSLIQWVTDYVVHLIRLILSTNHHGQNWKQILKYFDASCFLYLRQLLIIFYVLYQKNPNVAHIQPIFVTMANSIDITAQLFKLVTKLHQLILGENGIEIAMHDLSFSSLPMMYLEIPIDDPKHGMLSQTSVAHNKWDFDEYELLLKDDEWEYVRQTALTNPLSVGISTVNTCLRQIYDGINLTPSSLMHGESVKQCCCCGCLTIYNRHHTRAVNMIWKNCWEEYCFCGGRWKHVEWHG